MFNHVLILCHANICRSPAAEHLLREKLKNKPIEIQSAGLYAMAGLPAASSMTELLAQQNIDLTSHRSRQVNTELLAWANLVLVMEDRQQKDVEIRFPETRGKVQRLGRFENCDIVDPYQKSSEEFKKSLELIDHCLQGWQTRVWS